MLVELSDNVRQHREDCRHHIRNVPPGHALRATPFASLRPGVPVYPPTQRGVGAAFIGRIVFVVFFLNSSIYLPNFFFPNIFDFSRHNTAWHPKSQLIVRARSRQAWSGRSCSCLARQVYPAPSGSNLLLGPTTGTGPMFPHCCELIYRLGLALYGRVFYMRF